MKTSKGFTLIELMIVIAIIGILASVLIPALNSYDPCSGSEHCVKLTADTIEIVPKVVNETYSDYYGRNIKIIGVTGLELIAKDVVLQSYVSNIVGKTCTLKLGKYNTHIKMREVLDVICE